MPHLQTSTAAKLPSANLVRGQSDGACVAESSALSFTVVYLPGPAQGPIANADLLLQMIIKFK